MQNEAEGRGGEMKRPQSGLVSGLALEVHPLRH